jgi:hypothetical protein
MSANVLIILVGVILISIAILSSLSKEGFAKLIHPKIGIPLGVLGVLMVMFGAYASDTGHVSGQMELVSKGNKLELTSPVTSVKVLSPVEGDSVDCRILSMGVYPDGHDKDIWVVLRPTDDRYYPQSDHTNTSYKLDGEWQVVTRFGGDLGESYDLIVYETDKKASEFFSTSIEIWNEKGEYPGLKESELPEGATEVDRITVYLRKKCRGVF